METLRDVLLVALLIGLGWVLLQRMKHAMKKGDLAPEVVELSGTGVVQTGEELTVTGTAPAQGLQHLTVTLTCAQMNFEQVVHDGPVEGGGFAMQAPLPTAELAAGLTLTVHLKAPRSEVYRKIVLRPFT